ncbi:MAG: hypothetical protein GXX84_10750 [Acidobacteria bacterium]|nr:hypothetical protein [Acidobacteriota bacterium]
MEKLNLSTRELPQEESRFKRLFWPDVSTKSNIESVIDTGKITLYVIAGLSCLASIFRLIPLEALVDSAVFAAFGYGVGRKSRVCAVLALLLYVAEQVLAYSEGRGSWGILVIIAAFLLLNAVRGTIAWHRMVKLSTTSSPDITIDISPSPSQTTQPVSQMSILHRFSWRSIPWLYGVLGWAAFICQIVLLEFLIWLFPVVIPFAAPTWILPLITPFVAFAGVFLVLILSLVGTTGGILALRSPVNRANGILSLVISLPLLVMLIAALWMGATGPVEPAQ